MKGITAQLRGLTEGEQIDITGTTRANLYMLARRIGIKISVEKYIDGFYVTRLASKSPEQLRHVTVNAGMNPAMQKFMAKLDTAQVIEKPQETFEEWIDIGEHWNEILGEMVYLEQHYKNKQTRIKE